MNAENPSIGKLFGLSPGHGMNEFMRGEARADKVVRATQIHNVFAVLFGSESSRATLVELEKFSKAMEELSAGYDYVLIDSSECAVHSAVLGIAPLLDYTLMVVRSGQTRRESARQALDRLSSVKCPAIGVVLNGHSYVVPQFIYSRV
jgi:Mrp family chromosome partitioning ATPase